MLVVRKNQSNALSELFENFFSNDFAEHLDRFPRFHAPKSNIIEKEDSFKIEMMVPGYEKSDFQISLENNFLTIEVNKETSKEEENNKVIYHEFCSNSFRRSFNVSKNVNIDDITADYENGILSIRIPKLEQEPTKRLISVS